MALFLGCASFRYEELVRKQGLRHTRLDLATGAEREVLLLGGACSEVFSGPRLAKVLMPAFELQKQAMEALAAGRAAPSLSNHTCKERTNSFKKKESYTAAEKQCQF